MKHISAYFDQIEQAKEKFAWWPVRSSFSKRRIWLKKYVLVSVYYDDMGKPPIKGRSWDLIYTKNEYLIYMLKKDERKVY
jgi:hypothetical protein